MARSIHGGCLLGRLRQLGAMSLAALLLPRGAGAAGPDVIDITDEEMEAMYEKPVFVDEENTARWPGQSTGRESVRSGGFLHRADDLQGNASNFSTNSSWDDEEEDFVDTAEILYREYHRRLEDAVQRRIEVVPTEAEWLEEADQLPELEYQGLKLRTVITTHRQTPTTLRKVELDDHVHERLLRARKARRLAGENRTVMQLFRQGFKRRLHSMETIYPLNTVLRNPQDTVRLLVALNAAAIPDIMFTNQIGNDYWWKEWGPLVYEEAENFVYPEPMPCLNRTEVTKNGGPEAWRDSRTIVYCDEVKEVKEVIDGKEVVVTTTPNPADARLRFNHELRYMNHTRAQIKTQVGDKWKSDLFHGARLPPCDEKEEAGIPGQNAGPKLRCIDDIGVQVSVYADERHKVVLFAGHHRLDKEVTYYAERWTVLERMQETIMSQWQNHAKQPLKPEYFDRRGEHMDELNHRCAWEAQIRVMQPFSDPRLRPTPAGIASTEDIAKRLDDGKLAQEKYEKLVYPQGMWYIVKSIVRILFPMGRNMAAERQKRVIFSGTGVGGSFAALTAMYMKQVEAEVYPVYTFATTGFTCWAVLYLGGDAAVYADHPNIRNYHHIVDNYAELGQLNGQVCLFGNQNMTNDTALYRYCERYVGYTGPQLLFEPNKEAEPFGPAYWVSEIPEDGGQGSSENVEEMLFDKYMADVAEARQNFKACQYFAHSIFYAALLLQDNDILFTDGQTEGGCEVRKGPLDRKDLGNLCTRSSKAYYDCYFELAGKAPLPIFAMGATMFSLGSIIMGFGTIGFLCLKSMKGDEWIWGKNPSLDSLIANILEAFPCLLHCIKPPRRRHVQGFDRAKEAKLRRQEKGTRRHRKKEERDEKEGAIGFGMGRYRDLMHKQIMQKNDQREVEIGELLNIQHTLTNSDNKNNNGAATNAANLDADVLAAIEKQNTEKAQAEAEAAEPDEGEEPVKEEGTAILPAASSSATPPTLVLPAADAGAAASGTAAASATAAASGAVAATASVGKAGSLKAPKKLGVDRQGSKTSRKSTASNRSARSNKSQNASG
eukprot:TRINITY_DN32145_c0_g1_i1.p1 TRINITY_DN32145_c0_g1~~TRINITY_DN32145_c0_g1_i1.p1  ORF type:complete len:1056 (+),score=220.33 TRINITY_DN32145_c0_g1_i1:88-3255(+)